MTAECHECATSRLFIISDLMKEIQSKIFSQAPIVIDHNLAKYNYYYIDI